MDFNRNKCIELQFKVVYLCKNTRQNDQYVFNINLYLFHLNC